MNYVEAPNASQIPNPKKHPIDLDLFVSKSSIF